MSCYGYGKDTTPSIDALAREGTLYAKAISNACWTLPSHTTMFTGLYPLNHGLTKSADALPAGFPTLATRLKGVGYQTACFSNNAYISEATGLAQGFDTVEDIWRQTHPRGIARPKGAGRIKRLQSLGPLARPAVAAAKLARRGRSIARAAKRHDTDHGAKLTNDKILSWLGRTRRDTPFFAFVNYMESHERYSPPVPYDRKFMPARLNRLRVASLGSKEEILAGSGRRQAADFEILAGLYDGALGYLDQRVGELLQSIRDRRHPRRHRGPAHLRPRRQPGRARLPRPPPLPLRRAHPGAPGGALPGAVPGREQGRAPGRGGRRLPHHPPALRRLRRE